MPLPEDVIAAFNALGATKILCTLDEEGNVHAAPLGSLRASLDGSMLTFHESFTVGTPKRLAYMREKGKTAVAVIVARLEEDVKGYCVRCKVKESLTSGQIYEESVERSVKAGRGKPKAVWILQPESYKSCTGQDQGKVTKC
jgi:hypothetical protein